MNELRTMMETMRSMELDLLGLMFGYWILCLPFAFFIVRKMVRFIRKLY